MPQLDFLSHVTAQVKECNSNAIVELPKRSTSNRSKQVFVRCPPGEDRSALMYEFMKRWTAYKWTMEPPRSSIGTLELYIDAETTPYVIHFKDQNVNASGKTDTFIQEYYAKLCYTIANLYKKPVTVDIIDHVVNVIIPRGCRESEYLREFCGFNTRLVRDFKNLGQDWKHSHCKSANAYFEHNPYGNLRFHIKSDTRDQFVGARNLHYLRVCNESNISLNSDKNNPGDLIIVNSDIQRIISYEHCRSFEEFNELARQQFIDGSVRMVSLKKIAPTQKAVYSEFDYKTATIPVIEIQKTYYNRTGFFFRSNNAGIFFTLDGQPCSIEFRLFGGNLAGELIIKGKKSRSGKVGEFLIKHELANHVSCGMMTLPPGTLTIDDVHEWIKHHIGTHEDIDVTTLFDKKTYDHYYCRSKLKASAIIYLFRSLDADQQIAVLTAWIQHAMSMSEYTNPHIIIN